MSATRILSAFLRWRIDVPVILIDGVEYAGETMIVALGITADGTKRVLGLRQGATENAAVCVALLEDLQARGLDTSRPVLLVLDGANCLSHKGNIRRLSIVEVG
jgi:hypothetical protein